MELLIASLAFFGAFLLGSAIYLFFIAKDPE